METLGSQEADFNSEMFNKLEKEIELDGGIRELAKAVNYSAMLNLTMAKMKRLMALGEGDDEDKEDVKYAFGRLKAAHKGYKDALARLDELKSGEGTEQVFIDEQKEYLERSARATLEIITLWSEGEEG